MAKNFIETLGKIGIKDAVLAKFSKETGEDSSVNIKGKSVSITQKNYYVNYSDLDDESAKTLFNDKTGGFVLNKPDLISQDASILSITKEQKKILKDYKGIIDGKHLSAIRVSYAIMNNEDSKNWEDARTLNSILESKYRLVGKKIYNLTRSGYIEGIILTELHIMQYEYQGSPSYKTKFKKDFESYLDFFPHAVYANEFTTRKDLATEIMKRLRRRGISRVEVYGRGEFNITKITDVVNKIVDAGSAEIHQKENYEIGCNPATRIKLKSNIVYSSTSTLSRKMKKRMKSKKKKKS
ncbi:MAG: hypothetical protein Q7J68_05395 [Thermoplasmata archaeon]|nr:hypothetical protein [Thermoplasmata archaeon]